MFPAIREAISDARQGFGSDTLALNLRASGLPIDLPLDAFERMIDLADAGGGESWSGANVTTTTAMRIGAVWACINRISDGVAQLPIHTYKADGHGGWEKSKRHYLYRLLRMRANPLMSAFRFKRLLQVWLLQHGNALAYIDFNGRAQAQAMWPWHPKRVEMELRDGVPFYGYKHESGDKTWQPWYNMLHLRGMETDGFWGLSPIDEHRQTIGMAAATKQHGAQFFKNGAQPLGGLSTDQTLAPEVVEATRTEWNKIHGGLSNSHKIAILQSGLKYEQFGISHVDAQYIEEQQFTIEEIARIFNVQPHMIQHLQRSTNNNIEHQGLEWFQNTLGPWIVNWEQELTEALLSPREQQTAQIEFMMDAIKRADLKSRTDYYKASITHRWMKPAEVRMKENLPYDAVVDEFQVSNNVQSPDAADGGQNEQGN